MAKKNKNKLIFLSAVAIVVLLGVSFWYVNKNKNQGTEVLSKMDNFAQCLKDKGAIFYGAFWCPHCQNQKALFGTSQKYLPYVECSTPDGQSQNDLCQVKKISGYPTWEFKGGSRISGEISLSQLADKTGCTLLK